MKLPQPAPYGTWKSPISASLVVADTLEFEQILIDGNDVYWIEMRPSEGGRRLVVRRAPDGRIIDITPRTYSVRSRVHEYGGGAFTIFDGTIYFSNARDQRLYRHVPPEKPEPITGEGKRRYADIIVDPHRNRLVCVCEDHEGNRSEPINFLAAVPLDGHNKPAVLVSGNDFFSDPRLSPNGKQLAWLTWNHPNMPWDGTELWAGTLTDNGFVTTPHLIAGGPDESVFQPQWSPDGALYFVSDRSGWWNLYRWNQKDVQPVISVRAEFGLPQWVFGLSTFAFVSAHQIICAYCEDGIWQLARINTNSHTLERLKTSYTDIRSLRVLPGHAFFVGGSQNEPESLVLFSLSDQTFEVVRRSTSQVLDVRSRSLPETLSFPTADGLTCHGFFYSPQNGDFSAPEGEKPPLVILCHGGPTGSTSTTLNLLIQYWTSRGFAVLDVNYGGSTGYGRAYRQRLQEHWGIRDVEDCLNGARYLIEKGLVDPHRAVMRGSSAGGYTTLCALTFYDLLKAGASYYGISDLEALVKDGHKFESRYLDRLIGPYPACRARYRERSPIHFVDKLSCPVIFFQGLNDTIVPPQQAHMMVQALRRKGLPVAYLTFAEEEHGFRRAETTARCLEAELYFYAKIFGFTVPEAIEPVEIENL